MATFKFKEEYICYVPTRVIDTYIIDAESRQEAEKIVRDYFRQGIYELDAMDEFSFYEGESEEIDQFRERDKTELSIYNDKNEEIYNDEDDYELNEEEEDYD